MEICLRFWIEKEGRHVMGKGGYEILKAIKKYKSILRASKMLNMSYRFVWNYIRKMEAVLGDKVVVSKKGGIEGGETILTELGEMLIAEYERFENLLNSALEGVFGVVKEVSDGKIVIEVDSNLNVGDEVVIFKVRK